MVDVDFPYNTPALDQDAIVSSDNRANDNELMHFSYEHHIFPKKRKSGAVLIFILIFSLHSFLRK